MLCHHAARYPLSLASVWALVTVLVIWLPNAACSADDSLLLSVSENGRHLVDGNGEPFFWLADTGWAMFSKLTIEDAELYLENRRRKGFNVIQCILAHWSRRDLRLSPDGERPWLSDDPSTPNPAYFMHVDAILDIAREKGMILALLPAWGDFVTQDRVITTQNAYDYGDWLGTYYRDQPNIVWVLGGDRLPKGFEEVYRLLAKGIGEADGGRHLMTYHPRGGGHSSSEFFHEDEWLDFNMIQSSHSIDYPNYANVLRDYEKKPIKPTLDGEPRYENIIHGLRSEGVLMDDLDVRKAAYNAVLSGALGHTYGCNGIFQFWETGDQSRWGSGPEWRVAMDLPGAFDMGRMRALIESRDWTKLVPDRSLVTKGLGDKGSYVPAARAQDGTFAYLYIPVRKEVSVDLGTISGIGAKASWFDPRTGESTPIGEYPNKGSKAFIPPTGPGDPDYVLVLETAGPDVTPPQIADIIAGGDPTRVVIRFSEPLSGASASQAANFSIAPAIAVTGAELGVGEDTVTLTTSAMADKTEYTIQVAGVTDQALKPNPIADGAKAVFTYLDTPPRVTEGLQALYTFGGEGPLVKDLSGSEDPLDLTLPDEGVQRTEQGITITSTSLVATDGPAASLVQACMETNELTIEAWLKPANLAQSGPSRIVTLSLDTAQRNFTLGQDKDKFDVRLRTTRTGDNGTPSVSTDPGTLTTEWTHVVYTRAETGEASIWLNGTLAKTEMVPGDFSTWRGFRFGLANEMTKDRTWLGQIRLVALYNRALDAAEVTKNFRAGPGSAP